MRKNKSITQNTPTRHSRKVEQNDKSPHNLGVVLQRYSPHSAAGFCEGSSRLGFVLAPQFTERK